MKGENKISVTKLIYENVQYAFKCDGGHWHFDAERIDGKIWSGGVSWELDQVVSFLPMSKIVKWLENV